MEAVIAFIQKFFTTFTLVMIVYVMASHSYATNVDANFFYILDLDLGSHNYNISNTIQKTSPSVNFVPDDYIYAFELLQTEIDEEEFPLELSIQLTYTLSSPDVNTLQNSGGFTKSRSIFSPRFEIIFIGTILLLLVIASCEIVCALAFNSKLRSKKRSKWPTHAMNTLEETMETVKEVPFTNKPTRAKRQGLSTIFSKSERLIRIAILVFAVACGVSIVSGILIAFAISGYYAISPLNIEDGLEFIPTILYIITTSIWMIGGLLLMWKNIDVYFGVMLYSHLILTTMFFLCEFPIIAIYATDL